MKEKKSYSISKRFEYALAIVRSHSMKKLNLFLYISINTEKVGKSSTSYSLQAMELKKMTYEIARREYTLKILY